MAVLWFMNCRWEQTSNLMDGRTDRITHEPADELILSPLQTHVGKLNAIKNCKL